MKYKQLTLKERYHISTLLKKGWSQKEIAESIVIIAHYILYWLIISIIDFIIFYNMYLNNQIG